MALMTMTLPIVEELITIPASCLRMRLAEKLKKCPIRLYDSKIIVIKGYGISDAIKKPAEEI
jgi:hypothetical protein